MRWLLNSISRSALRPAQLTSGKKPLSTIASGFHPAERVSVPVGSSGSVHVDLYNLAKVSSLEPLLVYLPPFSTPAPAGDLAQLPRFAQKYATAVVHYRWTEPSWGDDNIEGTIQHAAEDNASGDEEQVFPRFHPGWPAPIHDTLKAYTWIIENLKPTTPARRDIYVYGSYLGASLATSLALTEAHPHERMAVRGCVAYNGIYNWTMFLPDHSIYRLRESQAQNFLEEFLTLPGDPRLQELKQMVYELFDKPSDLFDPFVSSCLFFHAPGLLVPPSFDESAILPQSVLAELPWLPKKRIEELIPATPPWKRPFIFPSRKSTLKIPEMLLLHDTPPPLPPSVLQRRQGKDSHRNNYGNSFQVQAEELASLMRWSINKVELNERMQWDESVDESSGEAERRIRVHDVGTGSDDVVAAWFEDRFSTDNGWR